MADGARAGAPPVAAALASQRSTGLWIDAAGAPLTCAPSWRDPRGDEVLEALAPQRRILEEATGLPLLTAWTAIKGAWLRDTVTLPPGARLAPLGSWVAARLCEGETRVDPTLANRMFLLDAGGSTWSEQALRAFSLDPGQLPALVPSLGPHGTLPWPGGARVPLVTLIGDQQAAYVGAAGPLGRRLVFNVGTAAFAMRAAAAGEPPPPGGGGGRPCGPRASDRSPPFSCLKNPSCPTPTLRRPTPSGIGTWPGTRPWAIARRSAAPGPWPMRPPAWCGEASGEA
ncbi:MAG: FGGY family carbohydrate kinase [Acidobacteriota bacterium]|nr:FGGY family carbohydrate kinase [Acidobacteriota bacterium]